MMIEDRENQNESQQSALSELRGMGLSPIEDGRAVIIISRLSTPNYLGRTTKATRYESPAQALASLRDQKNELLHEVGK